MFLLHFSPAPVQSKVVITPYIENRERFERHINPTLSAPADKNRSDLDSRLRVGVGLDAGLYSGKLEYQNAHDLYWTHPLNESMDGSDLSLAYGEYSSKSFTAILGRQKVTLGQQRLIGPAEWINQARSFDAGRVESGQWDLWAGKLGVALVKPETAQIAVLDHTDKTWGTTSLLAKHDVGTVSDTDIQTLDHLISHKFGSATVDAEGAAQYGTNNGKDQRAWAYHLRAAEDLPAKFKFSLEYNAASGGSNATTNRAFDNLYPSNHNLYGLADLIGWKNMNDIALKLGNKSLRDLDLNAQFHLFSLRDASDAWYSSPGTPYPRTGGSFIDPSGKSGRMIGKEFDFEAVYTIKEVDSVSGGLSFFEPGDFVRNVSGHGNQLIFGYLQYQVRF